MNQAEQRLVDRLLEVETAIRKAPARDGLGPYDVNPELVRLALQEADLLAAMALTEGASHHA